MKRAAILCTVLLAGVSAVYVAGAGPANEPPFRKPIKIADGIWFQQHHDVESYGSNVAWIEFADYVVVIDTAYPAGAEMALQNIKQTTAGKPIRYAIVTHYHSDHSFGAGAFARGGAIVIAHENARREHLARNLGTYAERAKKDQIAARYQPHAPDLTFTDKLVLDDGKSRRAELYYFGPAHTNGCIFTFLPREKMVFTGDAAVNGPFNYTGDADTRSWIDVLAKVQTLGAEVVVPGHGPVGKSDLLATQRQYFVELRAQVGALVAQGKGLDEIVKAVDIPMWKRWTGKTTHDPENITHVYRELTGSLASAKQPR